ncbi:MAG: AMP-binding protein [Elusimicrobia bacterium]|nr:AMP-binding protein [Elusimicrobiota bacterium]
MVSPVLPGAGAVDEAVVAERLAFLKESERWDRSRLDEYQARELKALLAHAAAKVPYYRSLLPASPDFAKIPLLTKETMRARHAEFLSDDADPATLDYMTTGGSTGDPLKIFMDLRYRSLNRANTHYYMDAYGFAPGRNPSVRLHGNTLPPAVLARGEYWLEEGRRLTMSVYHITRETAPLYWERMRRHAPEYLHAFPSALALLCRYAKELGLPKLPGVKLVFCDSETLYPGQRELVREVLGCGICNIYGHTEGAVMGMSCPQSDLVHLLPQIGVTEILRPDGTRAGPGERGEIVVTGFNNRVFPFIRYRTMDMAVVSARGCPCGRPYALLDEVEGRVQDYVVGRDGSAVPIAPALFDYRFDWSGIERFQVRQDEPGRLLFRVVRAASSQETPQALSERLKAGFGAILSGAFDIGVEFIAGIPNTSRGKFRYVDQRLPRA